MDLRRRLLNKLPIKKVQGHIMDGATWASLIQLYVKSMNSGQVPNIESSWTYICRSKAQQALANALEYIQKEFEPVVMPTSAGDLERLLQDVE